MTVHFLTFFLSLYLTFDIFSVLLFRFRFVGGGVSFNKPSNTFSSFHQINRHPNCLNKHRWEHTQQWREASKFVLTKHQQVQLLEPAAAILSFMGKDPTSLPEDRSEWPTFLTGRQLPKVGDLDPEEGAGEGEGDGRLAPQPHVLGYGSVGRGGIRRSNSRVRGRMHSSLFRRLCLIHLRLDRGCMIMRFVRLVRGRRLCRLPLGCWV